MKIIFSFALAFVLSLLCFPQIPLSFQDLTAPSNAFTYNDTSFSKIDEIYNGDGTFNITNFDKLLQQTSGISTLTSADLSALNTKIASANITANDMQGFATGGKSAGQDIVVRLGGLDWTPTYLSKTKTGDPILTLWLSNNEQDAFQTRTNNAAEGAYYGYVKSTTTNKYGLYSDWSADWYTTTTSQGTAAFYPSAMYGTSYIRSVTLNNGGQYATSNTELAADPGQNSNSIFAPFTMSSNPLSSFIATPSEVSWQEKQSATATNGASSSYDYPNDEWHPDTAQGKYYSDAYNYVEHNGYDTWKNDKLWLPSMAETGYSTSKPGLWNPSVAQRANYNGSSTSFTATIGTSENKNYATTAYTYSWLRSGNYSTAGGAWFLYPSGSDYNGNHVIGAQAVRPALHLNLNYVANGLPFTGLVSSDPSDPDIYQEPGENEGEVTFHIKSAQGLVKMSDYSQSSGIWDEKWTFLLDNDITIPADTTFEGIGAELAPFKGIFDGQGNTIEYLSDDGILLFLCVANCKIQNFNINGDVYLLIDRPLGQVDVSHINIYGAIRSSVFGTNRGRLYINDVNVYAPSQSTFTNTCFVSGTAANSETYIFDCYVLANLRAFVGNIQGETATVQLDQVYFEGSFSYVLWKLKTSTKSLNAIIRDCEFISTNASASLSDATHSGTMIDYRIYDILLQSASDPTIFTFGNYFTDKGSTYYYQGVYLKGATTKVLDPNFTPSKWFTGADGLPHLRHFYWPGQVA